MLKWTVAECCAQVHAPVGLDLGGDGPEAIALAVIAEVQACCMGKLGASRRLLPRRCRETFKRGWWGAVSAGALRIGCCVRSAAVTSFE